MFRTLPILLLAAVACGKPASKPDKEPTAASGEEKIEVPGSTKGAPPEGAGSAQPTAAETAPDPRFFLKPEEGTLTVDKGDGKAGSETTAAVKIAPATGY